MLEGSQIPSQLGAESRMDQLMGRLDSFDDTQGIGQYPQVADAQGNLQNPKSFKAMVSMMQAQMLGEAFNNDDKDSKSDNPMGSFINPMMMQNPAMAAAMYGGGMPGGGQNQQMMAQMMMQSMMGGGQMPMMPGMNPMAMMGMGQANPMMALQGFNQQKMVMPVKGNVSSEYGHRHHPIHGHDHFHTGVDIAADRGSPIRAPWDGRVVYVGDASGFGANTVIVAHDNQVQPDGKIIYSVFGHNDKAFVQPGEFVKAGEIFATVGSEGHSTGPHLHWETRIAPQGLSGKEIFQRELSYTTDPLQFA